MKSIKYSFLLIFLAVSSFYSQTEPVESELSPFSKLVGGEWISQNSMQTFEWGPGKKSVIGKSYFMIDNEWQLVGEGMWFWHFQHESIKGYFTVTNMPVVLFEYTTKFVDDAIISDLIAYKENGEFTKYVEQMKFVDTNNFIWTLYSLSPEGEKIKVMADQFIRETKAE